MFGKVNSLLPGYLESPDLEMMAHSMDLGEEIDPHVNYPRADPHLPATRQRRIAKDERQQARRSGEGVLMSST